MWNIPFLTRASSRCTCQPPTATPASRSSYSRGPIDLAAVQLQFLADYVHVSYSGTLAQWQAFFARRDALPAVLGKVKLERDAAGTVHFRSPRLDFDLPAAALKTAIDSPVQMQMTFGEEAGKPTWEIGAVYVNKDDEQKTYVGAVRQPKPGKDAGKEAGRSLAAHADVSGGV